MNRISLFLLYTIPVTLSIIVTEPAPSQNDYKYSYNIEDPSTGDSKSQHEVRLGDVVRGSYSVVDPDGRKRTVVYTADAKYGFKAIVRDEPADPPVYSTPTSIIRKQEPYVRKYQPAYSTVSPAAEEIRPMEADYYVKSSDINEPQYYFVPANEIRPEGSPLQHGQYFLPA